MSLSFGNAVPFSAPRRSSPGGLFLLLSGPDYVRRDGNAWVPDPEAGDDIHPPSVVRGAGLAPGETTAAAWEVWADPDHASQVKPGTYRFEGSITRPHGSVDPDEYESYTWTLTVGIARRPSA